VVGSLGAGKTAIIRRYVAGVFSRIYKATIGVDFALKVVTVDQNTKVYLQLWDIAGQERFGGMTKIYYKKAVGALIVFDVTDLKTFHAVENWVNDIREKLRGSPDIPIILLGNKCDLVKDGKYTVSQEQIEEMASKHHFIGWKYTSAKDNINIAEAVDKLLEAVLVSIRNEPEEEPDDDIITVTAEKPGPGNSPPSSDGLCKCGLGEKTE